MKLRNMVAYFPMVETPRGEVTPFGNRSSVEKYSRENYGHIIEIFYESSTRRTSFPGLVKAITHAERAGALLVIARFVAMSRNKTFLETLWKSGVDFAACDNAYANKESLPLLASLRIQEFELSSMRIRRGIQKMKNAFPKRSRRPLGNPNNLTLSARKRGGEKTRRLHSTNISDDLKDELLAMRAEGNSLRRMASLLNASEHRTKTGRPWSHTLVQRLLVRWDVVARAKALKAEAHESGDSAKPA